MSKMYWTKRGWIWELRQERYRGKNHPHDVCAIVRNETEARRMLAELDIYPDADYSEFKNDTGA